MSRRDEMIGGPLDCVPDDDGLSTLPQTTKKYNVTLGAAHTTADGGVVGRADWDAKVQIHGPRKATVIQRTVLSRGIPKHLRAAEQSSGRIPGVLDRAGGRPQDGHVPLGDSTTATTPPA